MKWSEIKKKHPNSFILLGNIIEERVSDNKSRLIEGAIIKTSDDPKVIRLLYQKYKSRGMDVLYTLPSTPEDLIIEDVPFMGISR